MSLGGGFFSSSDESKTLSETLSQGKSDSTGVQASENSAPVITIADNRQSKNAGKNNKTTTNVTMTDYGAISAGTNLATAALEKGFGLAENVTNDYLAYMNAAQTNNNSLIGDALSLTAEQAYRTNVIVRDATDNALDRALESVAETNKFTMNAINENLKNSLEYVAQSKAPDAGQSERMLKLFGYGAIAIFGLFIVGAKKWA